MIRDIYLKWFTNDETFPFYIQYGKHNEDMYVHTHKDFTELVIILGGIATHIVDGEEYPIKKGDVFVISDQTSHGYKNPKILRSAILCSARPIFWNPRMISKPLQASMPCL